MILYLHGFRSSPASFKAQQLAKAFAALGLEQRWVCPQLPASPAEAMRLCHELVNAHQKAMPEAELVIMGSSLGGYYATYLAEHYQARCVVLNPVVYAARDLMQHVGTHQHYHSDTPFYFLNHYLDELEALATRKPVDPQRYYLLACTGDEVLDWQEMAAWYEGSHGQIIEGGDHSISDFPSYQSEIVDFVLNTHAPAKPSH